MISKHRYSNISYTEDVLMLTVFGLTRGINRGITQIITLGITK